MSKQKKLVHKIKVAVVILMAVGVALSALAPIFAQEKSDSQKAREEISSIKEEIIKLSEDASAPAEVRTRVNQVSGVPQGFTFNHNLRERARGIAVRYMQAVLNTDPSTRVALSGPGSRGSETEYFGPATRAALIKFQQKHGIPGTAFLGSQTRAKMNEILRNGITIRETVQKDMEPLRERFREIFRKVQELREMVYEVEPSEIDEDKTLADCEEDIELAEEYAQGRQCTMEIREMSCGNILEDYQASNGCVIYFLSQKGWE